MEVSKAPKRYAKALLEYAQQTGQAQTVFEQMQSLYTAVAQNAGFKAFLQSPTVKSSQKTALITELLGNSDILQRLLKLLEGNRRLSLLPQIALSYATQYNQSVGKVSATVITAQPLSEALQKNITQKIKEITGSEQISLSNPTDPSIIGGFILRIDDWQYNASVKNTFNNLKKKLHQQGQN